MDETALALPAVGRARQDSVPVASSITHAHLLSVLNTEVTGHRILDMGCGTGRLIGYLHRGLKALRGHEHEMHGLDVTGAGFDNEPGFFDAAQKRLTEECPEIDWSKRFALVPVGAEWPYADGSFDCIVSNQVLEHVHDLEFVFRQIRAKLRDGGVSVHLFPLRNIVWEGHIHQPFAHRIINHDRAVSYIRTLSRFGIGERKARGMTHERFAEDAADSLLYHTSYPTMREVLYCAKRVGLRPSFRYTHEFVKAKLRSVLGLAPQYRYSARGSLLMPLWLLSCASSITLFLEKRNTHR